MIDSSPVVLGRISGLFGVKGWVKIHSYTEPREAILGYPGWFLGIDDDWQPVELKEGKRHGKTVIACFEGVDDRDIAAGYVNADIGVSRASLPETGKDEYYWTDLEGLAVEGKEGDVLGTVVHFLETGANDVMVVRSGDQEILIPFLTGDVIKDVDLATGVIRVDWEWD